MPAENENRQRENDKERGKERERRKKMSENLGERGTGNGEPRGTWQKSPGGKRLKKFLFGKVTPHDERGTACVARSPFPGN